MDFDNDFEECSAVTGDICYMCEQQAIDARENSLSVLCTDCRDKYSQLTVPIWVKCFIAAVVVITIFMLAQIPGVIDMYKVYRNAENNRRIKEFYPAIFGYMSVLEKYNDSVTIILNALDSAMGAQDFDTAAYVFDNYLIGKDLTDEQYERAMDTLVFLEDYYNTQELVHDIFEDYGEDIEGMESALLELVKNDDIDKSFIYFILGGIATDKQARTDYLLLSTKQDDFCTYTLAYYGNELRRQGSYDEALSIYDHALSRNASDTFAMRGIGIVMQLQGDISKGLQIIREAYDINPEGLYIREAIIIALCENALRDEAIEILELGLAEGYDFDQDIYDYLEGKLSIMAYYRN